MAVPGRAGALRGTKDTVFDVQTFSGVVLGIENAQSPVITKNFAIRNALAAKDPFDNGVRERDSGSSLVRARKILSGGVFAYNAALARTWVIARIATSLAGVANNILLFMGSANKLVTTHEFRHDFGVRMLTAFRTGFAWNGKLRNGNSVASRTLWLNADGTAAVKPTSLVTVNMWDLRDGNATDQAVDDAARPTRAIPGELVMKINFADSSLSGGNFYKYKPITGM
jgi:hypothetical protein